jgi:hypothetical protein
MKRALWIVIASCVAVSPAEGQRRTIPDTLAPRVWAPISYEIDSVLFHFPRERYPSVALPESFTDGMLGGRRFLIRWSADRRGFAMARCYAMRKVAPPIGAPVMSPADSARADVRGVPVEVACGSSSNPFRR